MRAMPARFSQLAVGHPLREGLLRCVPVSFAPSKSNGAYYWDGGYMGNPVLNPLVDSADDLLTVPY